MPVDTGFAFSQEPGNAPQITKKVLKSSLLRRSSMGADSAFSRLWRGESTSRKAAKTEFNKSTSSKNRSEMMEKIEEIVKESDQEYN